MCTIGLKPGIFKFLYIFSFITEFQYLLESHTLLIKKWKEDNIHFYTRVVKNLHRFLVMGEEGNIYFNYNYINQLLQS